MDDLNKGAEALQRKVEALEEELALPRGQLAPTAPEAPTMSRLESNGGSFSILQERDVSNAEHAGCQPPTPIPRGDYERYGRQMIVPQIGMEG